MKKHIIILAVSVIIMSTQILWADTTGKITGIVIDSETKEPLPGAIVNLLGTDIVVNADIDGKYIIENVPVGAYSLQIKMMGYKQAIKTDVKVIMDYTTTVNFKLIPATIEMTNTIIKGDGSKIKVLPDGGTVKILTIKEIERLTRVKSSKDNNSSGKVKRGQTQTIYIIPAEEIEHTPK